jgi:hypothetical protein
VTLSVGTNHFRALTPLAWQTEASLGIVAHLKSAPRSTEMSLFMTLQVMATAFIAKPVLQWKVRQTQRAATQ